MKRIVILLVIAITLGLIVPGLVVNGLRNPGGLGPRALGQAAGEAYIYGYPLVLVDVTRADALAGSDDPARPAFAMNALVHVRDLPGHGQSAVVRPNRDTLYSLIWLDLRDGPAILRWPEMGERYWLFQTMDGWTNVAGAVGSRTQGGDAGAVMITGPAWDLPTLDGMHHIEVPTDTAWVIGRIAVAPAQADIAAGRALQDGFSLTAPEASGWRAEAIDGMPTKRVDTMATFDFFERFAQALVTAAPAPADAQRVETLEQLGVTPGAFEPDAYGFIARWAMDRGVQTARTRLDEAMAQRPYGPTGWRTALDIGTYGTEYGLRAAVASIGLGANLPVDAIYPTADFDVEGASLHGDHVYRLRFEPGELPPAGAFWSITAYDADGFLQAVDQPTLGDRSALVFDADGGLTIVIAAERPDGVPLSNWIEVELGALFQLTARLYDPQPHALSGEWQMPPILPAD